MSRDASLLDELSPTTPEQWLERVEKDLKGADFDRALGYRSASGFTAKPLYHRDDLAVDDPGGFPGIAPFTRGFRAPRIQDGSLPAWQPAELVDARDPAEANRRLLQGLSLGVQRLWLRLGDGGVCIEGPGDMDRLLQGVEPRFIHVAVDGRSPLAAAGFFLHWARRQGVAVDELRGCFGQDPYARLARTGRLTAGVDGIWDQCLELGRWCLAQAPGMRAFHIDTTPYHDAGASPIQELAFGLASGVEILRRSEAAGLDVASSAARIETIHAVSCDIFLEIAKLRAWRRLWSRVLSVSGAGDAIPSQTLHLMPSGISRTVVDPWVNLLRSTTQISIGAMAGVDSMVADRHDALTGSGDDAARRMAINTHHVLAEESHLARVMDPAAGSWAVESLTESLAAQAWQLFRELEREGGLGPALESGRLARWVAEAVDGRRKALDRRKDVVVGVSMYADLSEQRSESKPVEAEARSEPEDGGPALSTLDQVLAAIDAEVSWHGLCRRVSRGEETHCEALQPFRKAESFEALRLTVDSVAAVHGRPKVCLIQLGTARDARARGQFAADFFATAGFDAELTEPTASAEDAVDRYRSTGAPIAVLCSSDERYEELAVPVAQALAKTGARRLYLAGRPGEHENPWRAAGIDDFIYIGQNAVTVLGDLVRELYGADTVVEDAR